MLDVAGIEAHHIEDTKDGVIVGAGDDVDVEVLVGDDFLHDLHVVGVEIVGEVVRLEDEMELSRDGVAC